MPRWWGTIGSFGAALVVAQAAWADVPWWKREPRVPHPEARRIEDPVRVPNWWWVTQIECTTDAQCAKQGNANAGEGFVCVDYQCRRQCLDSDAGVTKLPMAPADPQVATPGEVHAYMFILPAGNAKAKWMPVEDVDACKTPQFLQERVCRYKPVKSGKTVMLDSVPVKCPAGTECQVGEIPGTGKQAAFCGVPPQPPPPPACDPAQDPCCKDGVDLGLDLCITMPDCQLLASDCEDKCPDLLGLQSEYPFFEANGQGLCHQPKPDVCTDPDPAQTYPDATVICVNSGPATGACGGQTHLDMCATATQVLHVICGPDGQYVTDLTDCPPGTLCSQGLCAGAPAPEPICTDTDAANDPHQLGWIHGKSVVSGQTFSKLDQCQGTTSVVEYGCAPMTPDGYTAPIVPCATGETCCEGVCTAQPAVACGGGSSSSSSSGGADSCVCTLDTDAANSPLVSGQLEATTTAPGAAVVVKPDQCVGTTATQEFSCAVTPPCFTDTTAPCTGNTFCDPTIGACVLCEETSDVENDPLVEGIVHTQINGQDAYHPDMCLYTTTLRQYFCQDGKIQKVDSECLFGCESVTGVCKPDPCPPAAVDDGLLCTVDACDPATGTITHLPVPVDDLDPCTIDACEPSTGIVTHAPVPITDGMLCTIDACDPATGAITHMPVSADDGDACTIETCDPLTGGIAITTPPLDDNDACTLDSCNSATGNVSHTMQPIPSDGDLCTSDACNPATGLPVYTPLPVDPYGNSCAPDLPSELSCPDATPKLWLPRDPPLAAVYALHVYNGAQYAGGSSISAVAGTPVARFDFPKGQWEWVGEGLGLGETVNDLTTFNGQLYLATVEGKVYRLDGNQHWEFVPTPFPVQQVEAYGTNLFAAPQTGLGPLCALDGLTCSVLQLSLAEAGGGLQWADASAGLPHGGYLEELLGDGYEGGGELFVPISTGQDDQLYRYDTAQAAWQAFGPSYPNPFAGSKGGAVVHEGTAYVFAYPGAKPMLWRLPPGAALWEQLPANTTVFPQLFFGETLFGTFEGRVYRAEFFPLGKVTWKQVGQVLHLGDGRLTLDPVGNGALYVGLSQAPLQPGGGVQQLRCVPQLTVENGLCQPEQFQVQAVSAGLAHTCARVDTPKAPGTVWCWGRNVGGSLGVPADTVPKSNVPIQVPGIATAQHIAVGDSLSCAALSGGVVRCWGKDVKARGLDPVAAPGDPYGTITSLWKDIKSLDTNGTHTCIVDELGKTWCWGANAYGQLGAVASSGTAIPLKAVLPNTSMGSKSTVVTTGQNHTCALLVGNPPEPDGRVTCWGDYTLGQLGISIPGDPYATLSGDGEYLYTVEGMTAVDAGGAFTCAIHENGKVWCWGANALKQLGTPAWLPAYRAWADWVPAVSTTFASAGNQHACALSGSGYSMCWGNNVNQQAGVASPPFTVSPTTVPGPGALTAITAGGQHTCVLEEAGKISCWGNNTWGQLGNNLPYGGNYLPKDPYGQPIPPVEFCATPKDPYSPNDPYAQ